MKNIKALIFLFSANTISGFAQGVTMLAIPWHIIGLTDGKFKNAMMVTIVTIIVLFWGLYAGTLIDKYNRKHIFLCTTGIGGIILLSISGFGFMSGGVIFPLIALVYLMTVMLYSVHYPNLYAFVQELFEPEYYSRVNSAIEIQGQTTNFIGMMLGALLLDGTQQVNWWPESWKFDAWSLHEIFLLDGITYVLGFIFIALIPYTRSANWKPDKGKMIQRLKFGFNYLRENPSIFIFGIASHVLFFSLIVVVQALGPIYVKEYLNESASVLSFFKGFYALGALSAGLLGLSTFIRRSNLIRQIIFLLGFGGFLYFLLAVTQSIWITLIGGFLLGICNAGTRIHRITYLVRIVPNEVIGRANSIFAVVNVLMRASFIALLAVPFFADEGNGPNIIYASLILSMILFLAAGILWAKFDNFDREASRG